jgi:hypothetical protein
MRKLLIFNQLGVVKNKFWPYQKLFVYLHIFTTKQKFPSNELVHKMEGRSKN